MSVQDIQRLPRQEKLRLMEALWADLSREEQEYESPAWHGDALKETVVRLAAGKEQVLDWEDAKAKLRNRVS